MKKLGIVTISYGHNYGNKLQNYAMQEIYKNYGLNVKTIKFIPHISFSKKIKGKILNLNIKSIKNKFLKLINYNNCKNITELRIKNFSNFDKRISFTKPYYENNYKELINSDFDIFSVGSDQVWNPYFIDFSRYYLLNFIDKKKIAYAPSFGVSNIPVNLEGLFKNSLSKFSSLSCREESGSSIIKKLLNKNVDTVLDPTLLLDSSDWDKVTTIPNNLKNKKYVLLYFLGNISRQNMKKINEYAKNNGFEIINILDKFSTNYSYGPSEFIGIIKSANAVFTDSFHATVFSIIYKKPFLVFPRKDKQKSMSSRIDNLLNKFELTDRKYIDDFDKLNNVDYENAFKILSKEIEKSKNYIKKSLK